MSRCTFYHGGYQTLGAPPSHDLTVGDLIALLNKKEVKSLISDIKKALMDDVTIQSESYISLSLIDRGEVDSKLPININPLPERMYRFHFVVMGTQRKIDDPRNLTSEYTIQRGEYYAVEIAARTK